MIIFSAARSRFQGFCGRLCVFCVSAASGVGAQRPDGEDPHGAGDHPHGAEPAGADCLLRREDQEVRDAEGPAAGPLLTTPGRPVSPQFDAPQSQKSKMLRRDLHHIMVLLTCMTAY